LNYRKLLLFLGAIVFFISSAHAQDARLAAAEQQIEKRIAGSHADVAFALRTLDSKTEWF